MNQRVTTLLGIRYPIIQGGMVWVSGWRLASAVSNSGGLGVLGAGSMHPETLRDHIRKCRKATSFPFGVNVPLMYPEVDKLMDIIMEEKVDTVITSAGNPSLWTSSLKANGSKVLHVVSSLKFAKKAQDAGVDAVIAEGFEAGGHNGREETTTMVLIPMLRPHISIPLIAAGGIATGRAVLAAMALGADGVQIGSRFVATQEASCHQLFKERVVSASEGDTFLTIKELSPVRLLKNPFYEKLETLYRNQQATPENLKNLLGKGRAKLGMFEGDWQEGELEIGQVAALIHQIKPVAQIVEELMQEYNATLSLLQQM